MPGRRTEARLPLHQLRNFASVSLADVVEAVVSGRVRVEAADGIGDAMLFGRDDEEDPRGVFLDQDLRLVVKLLALFGGRCDPCGIEELVNALVRVERAVAGRAVLAAVEEGVEAVVGVTGDGDPAE